MYLERERLMHTSWLQNLNFKLGALRQEKRRGLAFYTGTSNRSLEIFATVHNFVHKILRPVVI